MINFANPKSEYSFLKKKINKKIVSVLDSNNYVLGKEVEKFEINFSKINKSKYCVGVSSGTDALIIALKALKVSYGDKVIVPSHTALATVSAIVEAGCIPIFADINNEFNIDFNKLKHADLKAAKILIAVHLYGNPCDIESMLKVKKKYKLKVIEDCSQAHLAKYSRKYVGNYGDISCYSFYPTKNLGTYGDAGAIITNNKKLYLKSKGLRQYGWKSNKKKSDFHGSNKRLDEIHAAILNIKLKYLKYFNFKRVEIAKLYLKSIINKKIILPSINLKSQSVYHLFVIRVPANKREKILKIFKNKKINLGIHYSIPCHLQKPYKIFSKDKLKVTEKYSKEILSLPIYTFLQKKEIFKICKILNELKL